MAIRYGRWTILAAATLLAGCSEDARQGGAGGAGAAGFGGSGGAGGDGGEGGSGGLQPPDGCIPLALGPTLTSPGGLAFFRGDARATPGVEGAHRTWVAFELYDWDRAAQVEMPLQTGTFDLTAAPDDDYDTCQHCALLVTTDANGWPVRTFFQRSGEVEVIKLGAGDEERGIAAATLRDVQFREIVQGPDGTWSDAEASPCYWIASWSFDTTPNNGAPCVRAEDCANTARQICDPDTGRCAGMECNFTGDVFCPEGQICLNQIPTDTTWGACYKECTPFVAGGCPPEHLCVPLGPTQTQGACKAVGTGRIGAPCDEPDISTGCEWGAICAGEPPVCSQLCIFLSDDPGCPADQVCDIDNVCKPPAAGDPAALGAACDPASPYGASCAPNGEAFAGICLSLWPEVPEQTCYELCRTDDAAGCGEGAYCAPLFANPEYGLCWPNPVCGDGEVDPLGEVCDDGGTEDGDGCSADCTAAEFGPLCEQAPLLSLDGRIAGTTVGGPTGYVGSCRIYQVVPAATYRFVPPAAGTLSLAVASTEAELDLLVLGDCADPESELGCCIRRGERTRLEVAFAEANRTALVAVVGDGIRDAGAFELEARFDAAVCGDGAVTRPERCDDGGTEDGDGCAADCRTVEWPLYCEGLPLLSIDTLNVGDTRGGDDAQAGAGVCAAFAGDGTEVMYRFTAPRDGRLTLRLAEETANHVLYVVRGCKPARDWEDLHGCSNFAAPDGLPWEELEVELARGESVTVVVEGFLPWERGPFALEAAFD